jgi:hypothetical protein
MTAQIVNLAWEGDVSAFIARFHDAQRVRDHQIRSLFGIARDEYLNNLASE